MLTNIYPGSCRTNRGDICVLPFKSNGSTYISCDLNGEDYNWCATSVDASGELEEWDRCFPFMCVGNILMIGIIFVTI